MLSNKMEKRFHKNYKILQLATTTKGLLILAGVQIGFSRTYGIRETIALKTPVTFTFKDYQYKDSPKNEMTFREFETACEQSGACSHVTGLLKTRCVRECVSPSCYRELYQTDVLEEGEIDVRLNSFKGCFIQRSGRTRN